MTTAFDAKKEYETLVSQYSSKFSDLDPKKLTKFLQNNAEYLDKLSYQYVETTAKEKFLSWLNEDDNGTSRFPENSDIEAESRANDKYADEIETTMKRNDGLREANKQSSHELISQLNRLQQQKAFESKLSAEVEELERQLADLEEVNRDNGVLPSDDAVFEKLTLMQHPDGSTTSDDSVANITLINTLDDLTDTLHATNITYQELKADVNALKIDHDQKQTLINSIDENINTLTMSNEKLKQDLKDLLKYREQNNLSELEKELESKCSWYKQMIELWLNKFLNGKLKSIQLLTDDSFKITMVNEAEAQIYTKDDIDSLRAKLNV